MLRFISMFCTILFISSCGKDTVEVSVDAALLPYFETFQTEAFERGVAFNVENSNISGIITNIAGNNIIAQCTHNVNEPSKVTVDIDYWNQASEQEKEFYIFHELGHCFLKRGHDDSKDTGGNCLSIMHSSADACKFVYNGSSRDSYLDELFDK
jgi:hypothetical protein